MKILQVCNYFSPEHGGSAEAPYRLSMELAKRGHDVTIFTTDYKISQEWLKSAQDLHIKVYGFKTWLNLASFQITPGLACVSKEIKSFDLIHMHNFRTFQNTLVHHYAKKYHIPCILQAHGSMPRIMVKIRLKNLYDKIWGYRILRDASKVFALSELEVEQCKSMGISPNKIEVITNGIDMAEYENLPERGLFRKKWGISLEQPVILFLGRIHKIKGLDILLEAHADILKVIPQAKLVIVGPDNGYLSCVKDKLNMLGINQNVLLTGPLYGQYKISAYIDADIYVLPSSYETFPVGVIEACACGLPVIISDRCGIANAIDRKAGCVVPYNDDALGKAIIDILSDANKKQEYGRRGKLLVRDELNWAKIAEQIEVSYSNIILN